MKSPSIALVCLCAACHSAPSSEDLVRAQILRENPGMNPEARFPMTEITPAQARETLGVQLFRIEESATTQCYETFAVRKGEVARLGTGFGGMGVGSTLLTDLDGDRAPDLVFVYSWGSGRHRSQVGVLRVVDEHLDVLECEWSCDGDAFLRAGPPGQARLANARGPFGTVRVVDGVLGVVAD